MENPSFLHGVHVFSMKFHDFSMGSPWYISVRDALGSSDIGCHLGIEYVGCAVYADDIMLLSASLTNLQKYLIFAIYNVISYIFSSVCESAFTEC